jgi:hypothetical protein
MQPTEKSANHIRLRQFAIAISIAIFCIPFDVVFSQRLTPLSPTQANASNPDELQPEGSTKEFRPLLPLNNESKQSPVSTESKPNKSGLAWVVDPSWQAPPIDMYLEPGTQPEPGANKSDPDSEFVQAVFLMPGPAITTKEDPPVIPESLRSNDFLTPQKNESLLAVERELNQALRNGEGGYLDSLLMEDFFQTAVAPYRVYRGSEATISVLPRSSRNLGWTSLEWEPYLKKSRSNGLTGSIQHHFLNGPRTIDLHPRLHDFILGYQHRGQFTERFSFDCAASVGIFSDFKGSARDGVRFPSHAVGIIHASHRSDFVFGVDYLDRDDYRILPVVGISWHDLNFTALRYDLVFPRPRIDFTVSEGVRYYLAGRLGGGTWDIEYPSGVGDVMTYRDFRLLLGKESRYMDGSRHGFEIGYVFGRKLMMRETLDELDFGNSMILRFVSSY